MADLLQMTKVKLRVSERDFPFVVQIAVPDGGFECTLGSINAWHHCNGNLQGRRRHYHAGEQEFWRWCFEGLEIAKAVRHRFGGEIMPVAVRLRNDRRPGPVSGAADIRGREPSAAAKVAGVAF